MLQIIEKATQNVVVSNISLSKLSKFQKNRSIFILNQIQKVKDIEEENLNQEAEKYRVMCFFDISDASDHTLSKLVDLPTDQLIVPSADSDPLDSNSMSPPLEPMLKRQQQRQESLPQRDSSSRTNEPQQVVPLKRGFAVVRHDQREHAIRLSNQRARGNVAPRGAKQQTREKPGKKDPQRQERKLGEKTGRSSSKLEMEKEVSSENSLFEMEIGQRGQQTPPNPLGDQFAPSNEQQNSNPQLSHEQRYQLLCEKSKASDLIKKAIKGFNPSGTAEKFTQTQPRLANPRLERSRSRESNLDDSRPVANEGARPKKHREPETTEIESCQEYYERQE